jgi:AsmA-like C-terminal region
MAASASIPSHQYVQPPRSSQPHSSAEPHTPPSHRLRWLWLVLLLLAGLLAIAVAIIAPRWPYSERHLTTALEQAFNAHVTFQQFHRFYFPHPGCEVRGLALTRPGGNASEPLATVRKMVIVGRYLDFLRQPHHLAVVRLDGLHIRITAHSSNPDARTRNTENGPQPAEISIGSLFTNGSILEIARQEGNSPLMFDIHTLHLQSVATGQAMTYQVSMHVPEPPGELISQGTFGPWQPRAIGNIPVHGTVQLSNASLDKYNGIAGSLRCEETFSGTLRQLYISGNSNSPDFQLKHARHNIPLTTQFHIILDALSGELQLKQIEAKIGDTPVHIEGTIIKNPDSGRRETSLDLSVEHGRTEDLLWLFNGDPQPPMRGTVSLSAHVLAPDYGPQFLKHLQLTGRFKITDGHFRKPTQEKANELSARAQGKNVKNPSNVPLVAIQTLSSDVTLSQAIAHLSDLQFVVPGATAYMHGTYNFASHMVDFHGDLRTEAQLSKDTSGFKSFLMRPLNPFFHRKHAGADIPAVMDGPIEDPHFGVEIVH